MRYVAVFFQRAEPADGPGARGALQESGACLRRQDQGQRIVTSLVRCHVSSLPSRLQLIVTSPTLS